MGFDSEPIGAFLAAVASEDVTPAGGACAAVVGAVGAALCEMACIHTLGAENRADADPELAHAGDELARRREQLLRLAESDARAVEALPDGFDGDGTGMKRATGVPLTIAEACLHVLDAAAVVTRDGTANVLPDARAGVLFADAALRAALLTVRTNTGHVEDPSFVAEMDRRTAEIESAADEALDGIERRVANEGA